MSETSKAAEKPAPVFPTADQAPEELRGLKSWVAYELVWDDSKKKYRKPPHSPLTGEGIGATEKYAEHFVAFEEAVAGAKKYGLDGVGFVFRKDSGYVGLDFDNCVEQSSINGVIWNWVRWFTGGWVESSPSGLGLHVVVKGKLPTVLIATPFKDAPTATAEAYEHGRFFTVTGESVAEVPAVITNCQVGIDKLFAELGVKESAATREYGPLSQSAARKIQADNLEALRHASQGEGNALLNTTAFFAGRASAAGALEQTESQIKSELFRIVSREWASPHPEPGARATIDSGWSSGVLSPLDLKPNSELEELVTEFNKKYFAVRSFGSRCVIAWEELNPASRRLEIKFQTVRDFESFYRNRPVVVGQEDNGEDIIKTAGAAWMVSRDRLSYDRVEFAPNRTLATDVKNLWRGFAFEPKKGDCSLYLKHLSENICQGEEDYLWLLNWMAYAVQHPGERGHTAPVFRGRKGVGKNVAAEGFANLWGNHRAIYSNAEHVAGRFNGALHDCSVVILDECFYAGNHAHEQTLKTLITNEIIPVEKKFVQTEQVRNYLHIIILSNAEWVVRATEDERRYSVFEIGDKHKEDLPYFRAVWAQLERGGYAALLYDLLHRDLSKFDPRLALKNEALRGQMAESLSGVEALWFECLQHGEIPGLLQTDGTVEVSGAELLDWAGKKSRNDWKGLSAGTLGYLFGKNDKRGKRKGMDFARERSLMPEGGKVRRWVIPKLDAARQAWDERRFRFEWDGATDWREADEERKRF